MKNAQTDIGKQVIKKTQAAGERMKKQKTIEEKHEILSEYIG